MKLATRKLPSGVVALLVCALLAIGCGDEGGGNEGNASTPEANGGGESVEAPTEIAGGATRLRLDEDLEDVLGAAGVSIEPGGAASSENGAIVIPITTGELDIDTLSGRIEHDGELRFVAAGHSIAASDLRLDAGEGTMTAEVAGRRIPLLGVDLGTPRAPETGDVIVLAGGEATLSDDMASVLNDRLGVDVFADGVSLGEVTVDAERR